ncbi:LLM class F420-dependent oxidoreductase [Thioalkalivibrio sp. HK1]|uniref:LLM class F420-dependent oxidoreductase n=1 Tax=Thioalkalivibrio sp. HK1 TaxID=1469245 RepID=UPI0004701E12|nr:LLM class F420-dependent oxidoreductase [Thioalkalivibrio sp. HK1]
MQIGIVQFSTDYTIRIDELAREAEDRGFESLFVPEHTHIPTCRRSPWPGGAELPREYKHTVDPLVGLAWAAAATSRLRIGTGIALLTERDPIVLAKECATLDMLSGGRFELGIGAGWNAEEMENHGTSFDDRFKVMCDRAKAIKTIWQHDEPQYHGPFVDFDPIWSYPKPVQKPNPPVLLGGESHHTLKRVVEFCDGWMPRMRAMEDIGQRMERLRIMALEAQRDPASISTTVFAVPGDKSVLDECRRAGAFRALIMIPPVGRDQSLSLLDRHARLLQG